MSFTIQPLYSAAPYRVAFNTKKQHPPEAVHFGAWTVVTTREKAFLNKRIAVDLDTNIFWKCRDLYEKYGDDLILDTPADLGSLSNTVLERKNKNFNRLYYSKPWCLHLRLDNPDAPTYFERNLPSWVVAGYKALFSSQSAETKTPPPPKRYKLTFKTSIHPSEPIIGEILAMMDKADSEHPPDPAPVT